MWRKPLHHRHWPKLFPVCTALVVILVIAGCDGSHEDAIGTYDGGVITRAEFDTYLQSLDVRRIRSDAEIPAEEGMRELLREFATTRILAVESTGPALPMDDGFNVTPRARYLVDYYRQRTGKRSHEVTEEEARAVYEERLESRFTLPESIRFQHVFLRADRHDPAELRSLEQRVLAEAEAGKPFDELVARYSESGSRQNAGIVGPVFFGRLEETFEEQIFRVPANSPPAVIRIDSGSHIVRVLDRQDARVLPFEEVKGQIVAGIVGRKNEVEREALFEELAQRYGVEDLSDENGLPADAVVIRVGEESMTRAELDHMLASATPFGAANLHQNPRARREMVDNLIHFKLMYLDAVDQGLDQEPNFVDRWQLNEQARRASSALADRLDAWTKGVEEDQVVEFFEDNQPKFSLPQRFDISYIFVPYNEADPFQSQLEIEGLRETALREGFNSPALAERCSAEGAICVNAGLMGPRDAARIGPKFQRTVLAMEEPGVSDPVKSESGLYVVAVHAMEERRPMDPTADMAAIRQRYVQLEQQRIVNAIREQVLEEYDFRIVASLAIDGAEEGR